MYSNTTRAQTDAAGRIPTIDRVKFNPIYQETTPDRDNEVAVETISFSMAPKQARPSLTSISDVPRLSISEQDKPNPNNSLNSAISRLIGSFLVGVLFIAMVFVAVMIRTERSADANTLTTALRLPSQAIEVSQVNKRSALQATTTPAKKISTEAQVSAQMLKESSAANSSTFVPMEVPINIVFDPRLVPAESAPPPTNLDAGNINNLTTATSSELESGTELSAPTETSTQQETNNNNQRRKKKKKKSVSWSSTPDKYVVQMDVSVEREGGHGGTDRT